MIKKSINIIKNYLFKKKLKIKEFDEPKIILSDNWSGNSIKGEQITNSKTPLKIIKNLDDFDFLRDLKSCGILKTRPIARKIVNYWIDHNTDFFSKPFELNVMANRITIMCMTYSWYAKSGELSFQKKVLKSIYTQLELLETLISKNQTLINFKIIKALIVGNIFLFNNLFKINDFLNKLKSLSERYVLQDGGHLSRCPIIQLNVLRDILEIRSAIASNNKLNSPFIQILVRKMGNYFKIFCISKDTFCSFNSWSLIETQTVTETLRRLSGAKKKFTFAKDSGYVSILSNRLEFILDTGNKNLLSNNKNLKNKASICAFELFYSKKKIITNVGSYFFKPNNQNNLKAISSTAAHSSLSIDDRNNFDLSGHRKINYLNVKTNEDKNGYLINVIHDSYKTIFGVGHKRTTFISKVSDELIGEDEIFYFNGHGIIPKIATIRFHLNHDINPIKLQNGSLLLQNKTNNAIGKFITSSLNTTIENTIIYENNKKFNSKQIVIVIALDNIKSLSKIITKWSFKFGKFN